jgi:dCTP deaminase
MILSDADIRREHANGSIVIEPFRADALGPNSYDVHLGHTLLYYQHEYLDARVNNPVIRISLGTAGFVMKPGLLYLAATEEYTETHAHVPYLDGKSSIGRLGIFIHATAGRGDIGFCGHWTMELSCIQPVKIYAGMPIGQLTYHVPASLPSVDYGKRAQSKYGGNRNPEPQPSAMWRNFTKEKP